MYKEMLEKMFPTRKKRMNFMANCALTFGIRLDLLSEIMGENKEYIYKSIYSTSLNFLFNHGFSSQEEAIKNFGDFFTRLNDAYLNKDTELIHEVLQEISDKKALDFKSKHVPNGKINDDEILTVLNYQLKYGLPTTIVSEFFNINRNTYYKRVVALEDNYPKLVSGYYYLSDYYQNLGKRRH